MRALAIIALLTATAATAGNTDMKPTGAPAGCPVGKTMTDPALGAGTVVWTGSACVARYASRDVEIATAPAASRPRR